VVFCFRNLFRRKVRTALCIIGVALATTFVIAVGATTIRYVTVIKEMDVLFNGQVMVASRDAIVIQAIPIGGSMLPQNFTLQRIREVESAGNATPILFVTPTSLGGIVQPVPINFTMGIPVEDWKTILGPTPLKGDGARFPTNESSSEVVVGASLADQYGWTVGGDIVLSSWRLRITGILDTKMALLNRCILMPLKLAQKVHKYPDSVNIIAVKPVEGYSQKNLTEAIVRRVSYVQALTEDERNDMVQPVLGQVETWNVGMQTVILAMSLILVMTVTVMSVSERRRDFATLDAIGAPLSYLFRIVVLEASLIGVLGGLLGIGFGSVASLVLASLYTNIPLAQFFPSVFEIVPPIYMLETFAAVILVCCVGGLVPALNATRMRIAEVLRAEY
jgi:putative ABC transport system permease protein